MSKLSPVFLKKPSREAMRYAFKDPSNPESEWVMWLRRLDPLEEAAAAELAEEYVRKYITGGWIDEDRGFQKNPCPLAASDGEVITLSEKAFRFASRLEMAQKGMPDDMRYDAVEILRIAPLMPEAWQGFMTAFNLLHDGLDPKAVWTAFTETPSESASDTELAT